MIPIVGGRRRPIWIMGLFHGMSLHSWPFRIQKSCLTNGNIIALLFHRVQDWSLATRQWKCWRIWVPTTMLATGVGLSAFLIKYETKLCCWIPCFPYWESCQQSIQSHHLCFGDSLVPLWGLRGVRLHYCYGFFETRGEFIYGGTSRSSWNLCI